jgi:hypothetical protein
MRILRELPKLSLKKMTLCQFVPVEDTKKMTKCQYYFAIINF